MEMLKFLGITEHRIIRGIILAGTAYVPQGSPCGGAQMPSVQIFSHQLQTRINKQFVLGKRNRVILIKRSKKRQFIDMENIEEIVSNTAEAYGLVYTLFSDDPVPSLNSTMRMFAEAVMVVAPHGAGLANLVFCQPKTVVVEVVCDNLCFLVLAHNLGHHYHAIPAVHGCPNFIDVDPKSIKSVMTSYIDVMIEMNYL